KEPSDLRNHRVPSIGRGRPLGLRPDRPNKKGAPCGARARWRILNRRQRNERKRRRCTSPLNRSRAVITSKLGVNFIVEIRGPLVTNYASPFYAKKIPSPKRSPIAFPSGKATGGTNSENFVARCGNAAVCQRPVRLQWG